MRVSMLVVEYSRDEEAMLGNRTIQYDTEGNVLIRGLPPDEWEDLSSERHFLEVYKITGKYFPIRSIKFDVNYGKIPSEISSRTGRIIR